LSTALGVRTVVFDQFLAQIAVETLVLMKRVVLCEVKEEILVLSDPKIIDFIQNKIYCIKYYTKHIRIV